MIKICARINKLSENRVLWNILFIHIFLKNFCSKNKTFDKYVSKQENERENISAQMQDK